jgi:hypothetical protein
MAKNVKWSFDADFIQACSCDYGCPCEFSAPPTTGFCEGMGAWKITRGSYGDVSLDGIGMAVAMRWPKAIHEGNGEACLYIDEKASPAQREVGDVMDVAVEPIKNPVTGEPESVRVEHSTGFIFKSAECVSTERMKVKAGELNFAWPDKAAFVAQIQYGN